MSVGTVRTKAGEPLTPRWLVRWFWMLPLAFYGFTASPTAGWVDAPFIARVVHQVKLTVWVNHHDLFTLLGAAWLRAMPSSLEPHYALNLLCSLLGAVTVYVVFRIGVRLTRNVWASAVGAAALMVSHSLWWHSTMLEVYTLSTVLLSSTLLFVVRFDEDRRLRDLAMATLFFGLACSNHPQMGFAGIGFVGLLARADIRSQVLQPKPIALLAGCFALGFSLYVGVFSADLISRTSNSSRTTASAVLQQMLEETTGGGFRRHMFPDGLAMDQRLFWWGYWVVLLVYNFVPPWVLFLPVGFVYWWRDREQRASFWFFALVLAAQVAWSANYMVWDMWAFSLPVYTLSGVLVIVGVDGLSRRGRRWRSAIFALAPTLAVTPWVYAHAAAWTSESETAIGALDRIPEYSQAKAFWDPLDYFLNPNKRGYDRVQRYATIILDQLEPNACYWGNEATIFYPLSFYYQDVLGQRADVSYHLIFGILEGEEAFRRHAAKMTEQLRRGCPVYLSSLGYPERNVLNHVYAEIEATRAPNGAALLDTEALLATFPNYRLAPIEISPEDGTTIFKFEPRR